MGSVGHARNSLVRSEANVDNADKNYFHHSAEDLELHDQVMLSRLYESLFENGQT